jgi:hypothetical protein
MKERLSAWSLGTIALILAGTMAVSVPAGAQRHNPAGSGGGSSAGGSGGSSGGGSGGSSIGGSGGSQSHAVPRGGSQDSGADSGRGQERAAPRGGDRTNSQGDSDDRGSNTAGRRRGDQPKTGDAVARTSPPRDGGDHNAGGVVVGRGYRGFDPWYGYGGYYGAYDPWFGWYPTNGSSSAFYDDDDGALRLKVKPVDATVYVDGYYVGAVDDFDGVFQRLRLESGPHRIEIRAPGYETLSFDVLIEPDHTTTYRGDLVKS